MLPTINIYTDGSHDNLKNISTYGVYFENGVLSNLNGEIRNNRLGAFGAELHAIYKALGSIPRRLYRCKIIIYTDSSSCILSIGNRGHELSRNINQIISSIKWLGGSVKFKKVDSGSYGNHHADKLSFQTLAAARHQDPVEQYNFRTLRKLSYMMSDLETPYEPKGTICTCTYFQKFIGGRRGTVKVCSKCPDEKIEALNSHSTSQTPLKAIESTSTASKDVQEPGKVDIQPEDVTDKSEPPQEPTFEVAEAVKDIEVKEVQPPQECTTEAAEMTKDIGVEELQSPGVADAPELPQEQEKDNVAANNDEPKSEVTGHQTKDGTTSPDSPSGNEGTSILELDLLEMNVETLLATGPDIDFVLTV